MTYQREEINSHPSLSGRSDLQLLATRTCPNAEQRRVDPCQKILQQRANFSVKAVLASFYHFTVETVLSHGIQLWFASCTAAERKARQRVINTDRYLTGCPFPNFEDIYNTRCLQESRQQPERPTSPWTQPVLTVALREVLLDNQGKNRLKNQLLRQGCGASVQSFYFLCNICFHSFHMLFAFAYYISDCVTCISL